jgi:hypothetical protein
MTKHHAPESDASASRALVRWTIGLVIGPWILNGATIWGIWEQHKDATEQRKNAVKQRAEQSRSAVKQREDARELLSIQIGVELDREWDSADMHRARRKLASQLLNKQSISEYRVFDFF